MLCESCFFTFFCWEVKTKIQNFEKCEMEENSECNTQTSQDFMSVALTLWEVWPIKAFKGAINKVFTEPKARNDHNTSAGGWWGMLIDTSESARAQPAAEISAFQSSIPNPNVEGNMGRKEPMNQRKCWKEKLELKDEPDKSPVEQRRNQVTYEPTK